MEGLVQLSQEQVDAQHHNVLGKHSEFSWHERDSFVQCSKCFSYGSSMVFSDDMREHLFPHWSSQVILVFTIEVLHAKRVRHSTALKINF